MKCPAACSNLEGCTRWAEGNENKEFYGLGDFQNHLIPKFFEVREGF